MAHEYLQKLKNNGMYLKAPLKSWVLPAKLLKPACNVLCHQEPSGLPDNLIKMPTKIIIIKNQYLMHIIH